jgi:hypothetical protein
MKNILQTLLAATALASGLAAAQESSSSTYASDLSRVYEASQFIHAAKEACDAAEPDTRKANDVAYTTWRKQHQSLLDELERRFLAMVRRASTDQKDYSKNVGRYAGEVLQNLEELKRQFLSQPPESISQQCRGFPDYLKGKDADLPKRYAAELNSIRKRKL